ncbi:MAG: type V CRISPR-associated protein Cas12b, partial [Verrucomicrobiota bacterium]
LTARILRLFLAKPKVKKENVEQIDFTQLGDDPIKLARGKRGYVFPAFTAFPAWKPKTTGKPVWKEFDIAAFKEALKGLNQFNQKTEERELERKALRSRYDYMLGLSDKLPDDEETKTPRLEGDERFELAKQLIEKLAGELQEAESDWGITRSALRGFNKISEQWFQLENPTKEELEAVVKKFQVEHRDDIGAVPLFLTLCEERFHPLWKDIRENGPDENPPRAKHMLWAMCDLNQIDRDLARKEQPINLTPAEPVHSRRLFMFSDISSSVKFLSNDEEGRQRVEVSIARDQEGTISEERCILTFSAPRLRRDELAGGEESRWLQPMMEALGLNAKPPAEPSFESAVALMPQVKPDGSVIPLLNFPVALDPAWLTDALGKAEIWKNQFNGVRDHAIHLHWPDTATAAAKKNSWHDNSATQGGFDILSYDFGQRMAGAWALLHIAPGDGGRWIGNDGMRDWSARLKNSGTTRLPGENAWTRWKGEVKREVGDKRGRFATRDELAEAIRIGKELGFDEESCKNWLSPDEEIPRRYPELNDALIRMASARLSRLNTYHRWSCTPDKDADRISRTIKELEGWPNHQAWKKKLESGDVAGFRKDAAREFDVWQKKLKKNLLEIANRTQPLRGRKWEWKTREGGPFGYLAQTKPGSNPGSTRINFQRGISFARIEQLEGLRRLFQRYNRSLDRKAGTPQRTGKEARDLEVGEPCPDLLAKMGRMKEERVNLTAHLILAQALGLRLREHSSKDRKKRDIHGEYEPIPGRKPVDFIVIEDLSRYQFSQGRAPRENSRLMKWSHRAVRDKLIMLCEPFGLPVVEAQPGYSSQICSETSRFGFRANEVRRGQNRVIDRLPKENPKAQEIARQFAILSEDEGELKRQKPRTLIYPQVGGALFVGVGFHSDKHPKFGPIREADINAAINIGLRAVAAPNCHSILAKVRVKQESGKFS